jgi:hypothetical protein
MTINVARVVICALTLLSLCACVSAQELRAQDEAACASYGFQPGTPDFAGCLQRESLARNYAYPSGSSIGVGLGFGFGL